MGLYMIYYMSMSIVPGASLAKPPSRGAPLWLLSPPASVLARREFRRCDRGKGSRLLPLPLLLLLLLLFHFLLFWLNRH